MRPDPVFPHRSPARLLAPLSLVLALVALVVTVTGQPPRAADVTGPAAVAAPRAAKAGGSYVVRAGDTLSLVAERHGTTLEQLERLNPGLDPQTVQTGARLRLPTR
jgi:LysM repeat protein